MARFITITKVSIENIKEVPEYKELIPENNSYEELKKSIQQLGFLDPITVNKKYEILDGYTRYRIAKELGIKEIPVEIYETSGREEELDIIASFNLKRRHLSKDEIIALIDKITEKKKALKTQMTEKFEKQKNEIENEKNAITPYRILPADTDKISTKQESREIKEELERLAPNVQINEETIRQYLQVKKEAPWLVQYIGDEKKGKIGIKKAYDIYRLLKEKNLLDLDKLIPKPELSSLITDKYGRKVLERDDLLQLILDHKMATSQAINKIKTEEKLQRSKKKSRVKEEHLGESEDEGEEVESDEEYDLVGEWQRAKEEEAKQQLTPQFNGNTQVITQSQKEFLQELDRLGSYARIPIQIVNAFNEKGFFEIPERSIIARIGVRLYVINEDALRDLEQGKSERWKELVNLLSKADLIVPDEDGIYTVMWRLLCKCQ
jgi:ParB-like chromosome segregation protein Spo0J